MELGGRAFALREREDVGRLVLAAVVAVQDAHLGIADEPERHLVVGARVGLRGRPHHARDLGANRAERGGGDLHAVVDRDIDGHYFLCFALRECPDARADEDVEQLGVELTALDLGLQDVERLLDGHRLLVRTVAAR